MASNTVKLRTEKLGTITRTSLAKRVKEAGSSAKLARELGVADSTVNGWRYRLNLRSQGKY